MNETGRGKRTAPAVPSIELFRELVENARECIFIVDRERRIQYANQYLVEFFGCRPEEVLGRVFDELIHPECRDEILERHRRRIEGEAMDERREVRLQTRSGEDRWGDVTVSSILDGGVVTGVRVFVRDITGEKRTEMELREWKNRYVAAVRASGHILYEYDPEADRVMYFGDSEKALGSFEIDDEWFTLPAWAGLIHPEDREGFLDQTSRCIATKAPFSMVYRVRRKSGDYITVEDRNLYFPGHGDSSAKFIGTITDVTARVRVQEELRRSESELRNLAAYLQDAREKERTQIAREVHDDLGTTLAALRMELSLFARALPEGDQALHDRVGAIGAAVDRTVEKVREIASWLRPGVLDDLGLTAAIEWLGQDFGRRSGITCKVTSNPKEITLDQDRSTAFFRIFQETLANIGKHAGASRVEVRLERVNGCVKLEVSDDGRSIPREKIFHPESLGLMGMRERALLWDGHVDVRPGKRGGTRVTAIIPIGGTRRDEDQEGEEP